jgi:Na+-translocating ferredoxin:NAD+ oxidoreductase subunit G
MKIFKTALVLTLIGLACGLLIGFSNHITAPVIAENKRKAELKAFEVLFPNLESVDPSSAAPQGLIYEVLDVRVAGAYAGRLYKGTSTNAYGKIDVLVGIDKNGVITGVQFLELDQTASVKGIIEENALVYKGKNIDSINLDDLIIPSSSNNPFDTASGASFGSTTMRLIIKDAILSHSGVVVITDPYQLIFGPNIQSPALDAGYSNADIESRETINDESGTLIGYAYIIQSVKNTEENLEEAAGYDNQDWLMTLLIGIDLDGRIVGIQFLSTQHSGGFYNQASHIQFLDSLKGVLVSELDTTLFTATDATFSRGHIIDLLMAFKGAL